MEAAEGAFGSELEDHDWEREQKILPPARALAAFDAGKPVGLAGAYAFDLAIPGGELPCAGVTWVGVLPTHRRRGILRDFMRHQLDDVRGWGEPIAALWASEASIYGRFGYGARGSRAGREVRHAAVRAQGRPTVERDRPADRLRRGIPPLPVRLRRRSLTTGGDAVALGDVVEGVAARRSEGVAPRREPEVLRRRRGGRERRGLRDVPRQGRVGGRVLQERGARRRGDGDHDGGRARAVALPPLDRPDGQGRRLQPRSGPDRSSSTSRTRGHLGCGSAMRSGFASWISTRR